VPALGSGYGSRPASVRQQTRTRVKPKPAPSYSTVSSTTGARSYRGTRSTPTSSVSVPAASSSGSKGQSTRSQLRAVLAKAAKKSQGGLASKLDRGFSPGETITPRETAIVAESEGLPGKTYALGIAPGESGHQPGIPNPDDATPSLFQITPSVQSSVTQAKFNKIASRRPGGYSNPIVAAKQAKVLAKGSSDAGVSNYVAYNPSAPQGHLPGGEKRADKLLYGKQKPIPKPLKQKAKRVLGEKTTQKVITKAKQPALSSKPTKLPGIVKLGKKVERKFGVEATEHPKFGGVAPVHSPTGYHPTGEAIDIPVDPEEGKKVNRWLARKYGSGLSEMFYDPGVNIKDGQETSAIGGHGGHIHVAIARDSRGRFVSKTPATVNASSGGAVSGGYTGGTTAPGATASASGTASRASRSRSRQNLQRKKLLKEILGERVYATEEEPEKKQRVKAATSTPVKKLGIA
jgi:hypothetical protein